MKITESKLRQIIQQEYTKIIHEGSGDYGIDEPEDAPFEPGIKDYVEDEPIVYGSREESDELWPGDCSYCGGEGTVDWDECPECLGTGSKL